jgi:heme/copper-type cytochrome/quinol oxidase subunit 2
LDYILMEDLFFAVLSILMLVVLVAGTAWLPHLRKTLTEGGQGDGGSLWRKAVLRTAWCVVIPVLVYFVLTRFTAFGGRLYGVPYLWPRLLLQLETLAVTMVLLDRYLFSSGSAPHPVWRARWLVPVGLAGLAFLLPVDWLTSGHKALALTAMSVPVAILILTVIWLALRGRRDHRPIAPAERYERRAVALLALGLSVLVLTLGARGVLRLEERQNVRQEALLKVDPSQGGFTVAEAKLARTLRDQVLKAAQAK